MVLQGVDVNAQNKITILKLFKYFIQPFHNILFLYINLEQNRDNTLSLNVFYYYVNQLIEHSIPYRNENSNQQDKFNAW